MSNSRFLFTSIGFILNDKIDDLQDYLYNLWLIFIIYEIVIEQKIIFEKLITICPNSH
jgi:hypothetical protein